MYPWCICAVCFLKKPAECSDWDRSVARGSASCQSSRSWCWSAAASLAEVSWGLMTCSHSSLWSLWSSHLSARGSYLVCCGRSKDQASAPDESTADSNILSQAASPSPFHSKMSSSSSWCWTWTAIWYRSARRGLAVFCQLSADYRRHSAVSTHMNAALAWCFLEVIFLLHQRDPLSRSGEHKSASWWVVRCRSWRTCCLPSCSTISRCWARACVIVDQQAHARMRAHLILKMAARSRQVFPPQAL